MAESVAFKNVQIIDGALNATYSLFQATPEEFDAIFPHPGQDMEIVEDFLSRAGQAVAADLLKKIWMRPILKRDAQGIHGTLFYDFSERREFIPSTKREVDWNPSSLNSAQRILFAASK